ncbi:MAG: universal stress protein UspA-like protein [Frankiales bacterium]|nr:universal stress protein UspA-like protein [Frankiales bacterium]
MSDQSVIVVGVNGSESSRAAVTWAAAEAASRHAAVRLVHAWEVYPDTRSARLLLADDARPQEAAVLAEASEQLRSLAPGVEQESELGEGRPDEALLRASENAVLLVVGRHGGSAARLGPTLGHLSVRSGCPVVAVPAGPLAARRGVVVGVDGSTLSVDAVGFAFEQAPAGASTLPPCSRSLPPSTPSCRTTRAWSGSGTPADGTCPRRWPGGPSGTRRCR